MNYLIRVSVEAAVPAGYCFSVDHNFRAVSPKHALKKAIAFGEKLPGYADRVNAGIPARLEAEILPKEGA